MQTETKHTPGPWRWVENVDDDADLGAIVGANGKHVCGFGTYWSEYEETSGDVPSDADKALMLAAPDLLAALEQLVAAVASDYPAFDADGCLIPARDAIAKAKGGAR